MSQRVGGGVFDIKDNGVRAASIQATLAHEPDIRCLSTEARSAFNRLNNSGETLYISGGNR